MAAPKVPGATKLVELKTLAMLKSLLTMHAVEYSLEHGHIRRTRLRRHCT